MNTWIRKVGMGALALTLAGVLGGCNNGGGSALIRLFFGINGSGNCTSVIVEVNLEEANAVIARDDSGAPQCDLDAALENAGCDITYTELENGVLRATISGCTIPGVASLFSCLFEDVDISDLQETAFGQCACQTQGCDGTPPVCISEVPDPRSCEDCDNDVDDDGDGLIDCEDPQCENDPACEEASTTTTSSTSTSTSSTTSSSTTTTSSSITTSTTLEARLDCRLVFRVTDAVTIGALQWDTDYSEAPGFILGSGLQTECDSLIEGALFAANDIDDQELVDIGLASTDGFTGPIDVAECTFKAFVQPDADQDFEITVTEATTPGGESEEPQPIDPLPTVIIKGSIVCEGDTTTTTTTTIPEETTTTTLAGGDQDFDVKFVLANSSEPLGALQFTVNYGSATGDFAGQGEMIKNLANPGRPCTRIANATFATNDTDASRSFNAGFFTLDGVADGDLFVCVFNGQESDPPVPGDFQVTIVDIAGVENPEATGDVNVTVTPK